MTTRYTSLIDSLTLQDGAVHAQVPEDWLQGRTAYGGLSAALALGAAQRVHEGLPPLRTAQTAFIGPAAGALKMTVTLLRAGKSMTFIGVDAEGEKGLCTRCLFGFGEGRESEIDYDDVPMPDVPGPEEAMPFGGEGFPAFMENFEIRAVAGAMPFSGAEEARWLLWARHRDEAARRGPEALLALADVPPPAFLGMLTKPAPAASVTWQADFLTHEVDSEGGWYLLGTSGEAAVAGYGGQAMMAWARDGEPVMGSRQCCAVFG
jgi:acyl-CoA thioesterase